MGDGGAAVEGSPDRNESPGSNPRMKLEVEIRDNALAKVRFKHFQAAEKYLQAWRELLAVEQSYNQRSDVDRELRQFAEQMSGRFGAIGGEPGSLAPEPLEFPVEDINTLETKLRSAGIVFRASAQEYKLERETILLEFRKKASLEGISDFDIPPVPVSPDEEGVISEAESMLSNHDRDVGDFFYRFGSGD